MGTIYLFTLGLLVKCKIPARLPLVIGMVPRMIDAATPTSFSAVLASWQSTLYPGISGMGSRTYARA